MGRIFPVLIFLAQWLKCVTILIFPYNTVLGKLKSVASVPLVKELQRHMLCTHKKLPCRLIEDAALDESNWQLLLNVMNVVLYSMPV